MIYNSKDIFKNVFLPIMAILMTSKLGNDRVVYNVKMAISQERSITFP